MKIVVFKSVLSLKLREFFGTNSRFLGLNSVNFLGIFATNLRNFGLNSVNFAQKFTKFTGNCVNFSGIFAKNSRNFANFLSLFIIMPVLFFVTPILFSACAVVQKATPNPTAHIIKADENIVVRKKNSQKVLKINPIQSLFYLKSTQISYIKDNELGAYTKHLWGDSSVNLVKSLLAAKVEKNGIFKAVLIQSSGVDADLVLESSLEAFEQVFDDDLKSVNLSENSEDKNGAKDALHDESVVKIELNARLIDNKAKKLLSTKNFTQSVKVGKSSPQNAVRAFSEALNRLGDELIKWLANFS